MTDQELEQALRGALRPRAPGEDFSAGVMARIQADRRDGQTPNDAQPLPVSNAPHSYRRPNSRRWSAPAALAACALVAVGLMHWRHESADRRRGVEARAQLLQALSIAGAQVNSARAAVLREEGQPN